MVAVRHLRYAVPLRPHVTNAQAVQADASLQQSLWALRERCDLMGDYLEQVLWPLAPHLSRHAVRAFILETRREARDLAASHRPGDVYVETFTIKDSHDRAVSLAIEGRIGGERDVLTPWDG